MAPVKFYLAALPLRACDFDGIAVSLRGYEKSIDLGATADGCSCDPYNPLLGLYTEDRRYDQSWGVVRKAQKSKKWIAPEALDRLKKESGRSN
jgi:hypothetical protein